MRTSHAPAFVGRGQELDELMSAVHRARQGHGQAIFLVGEDGIGKSRLAAEVAEQARASGACVAFGYPSAVGPTVLCRPLVEVLLRLLRTGNRPEGSELGPYRNILGRLIPEYSGGDPGEAAFSLITLAEAVLRVTALAARDRGCLIILDDLHDMDADTLAVVEYMSGNLAHQSTVLLATIRADHGEALEFARAAVRRGSGTMLTLGRLDRPQVRELIAARLSVSPAEAPDELVSRVWADSVGNPALAEALLSSMISREFLVLEHGAWRLVGEPGSELPGTLMRGIARRADRLGPQGRMLLTAAAIFGRRFPLSAVQAVTGLDSRDLLRQLDAATAADLVEADSQAADWHQFVQPLMVPVLLRQLTPAERASLAERAAQAVRELQPALPDDWCQLAASLEVAAGNMARAVRLFAEAGTRLLADGRAGAAIDPLERANELLRPAAEPVLRAEVLGKLAGALAEAGQAGRARRLADQLDEVADAGLDTPRIVALRTAFALAACAVGRWQDAAVQAGLARHLLGPDAGTLDAHLLDAVGAWLALRDPEGGARARELAERVAYAGLEADAPVAACLAWHLLGISARPRDLRESDRCFHQAFATAREHRLVAWRLRALLQLGVNNWLVDGDTTRLLRVRREAHVLGAVLVRQEADAAIAVDLTFRGEFGEAAKRVQEGLAEASRLDLADSVLPLYLAQAVLAAHQGRRRETDSALARLRRPSGPPSPLSRLAGELAGAFCALLEDDQKLARRQLAEAVARPGPYALSGQDGLALLLEVVYGEAGWSEYREVAAAPAARLRWNRQFIVLARAVLLGRARSAGEALTAMAEAAEAAASYPMARHLGLRLAAEAAYRDQWGEPVAWLRQAEEHFHIAGVTAVASSCRALLRQIGEPVVQRRNGLDHVPADLRKLGVTVREYEILQLLAARPGNKAIAARLYISPRTVEKHVASLIGKIGQPDRASLSEFASGLAHAA